MKKKYHIKKTEKIKLTNYMPRLYHSSEMSCNFALDFY